MNFYLRLIEFEMKKILTIIIFILSFQGIAEPWKYEETVLHPYCFQTEWISSDNLQEFYERFMGVNENYYDTKEFEDFSLNIGKYWGKEINDFSPIKPSWGDSGFDDYKNNNIELLAVSMESCLGKTSNNFGERDDWITSSQSRDEYSYKILKKISSGQCQSLAPNLKGKCLQSYLLQIFDWGGGSSSWQTLQIFGLFEMPENKQYIFPLKKFRSKDDEEFKSLFQTNQ